MDFRGFWLRMRMLCSFCWRSTKHCVGARILSFELLQDDAKSLKNRSESEFDRALVRKLRSGSAPGSSGGVSGPARVAFRRFPCALGPPRAPQDRSRAGFLASQSRPERVWTHPRTSPGRPERRKINLLSILRGFWLHFRRFSNDFSFIFARAASDEAIKSESRKGVA